MTRCEMSALPLFALGALCLGVGSCRLPTARYPDLLPGVMTFTGDFVADGGTLPVTLPVENRGTAAASAFTVHFYLAQNSAFDPLTDTDLGTSAGASVAATASVSVSASLAIPELNINEARYVYAVVDSTDVVAESDETNNQSTPDTAAAVLVYDDENGSRTYDIVLQTYLGSNPSITTGSTDTMMALYHDDNPTATYLKADLSGASDFSRIDHTTYQALSPGTYYVVVMSWTGGNGPYALSVRTDNIDLQRSTDLASNAEDTWEPDDTPATLPLTVNKTIPTKPDPIKVGSARSRYSSANDWDWFKFVLP